MKLGERIKLLRTEQNWTQPELAEKAGVEQSYLSKLENEKGSPSFEVINKVAKAFDRSGMELIQSLSQTYIEEKLSHIPEIAAEYASIRERNLNRMKSRYYWAVFIIVLGVGASISGYKNLIVPELYYKYTSNGILLPGETDYQFYDRRIHQINESNEEMDERVQQNKSRLNLQSMTLPNVRTDYIVKETEEGRRAYFLDRTFSERRTSKTNDFVAILGVMLIFTGLFMMFAVYKFRQ